LLEEPTRTRNDLPPSDLEGRGKKEARGIVAGDLEGGKRMVGAMDNAREILEGVIGNAPAARAKCAA
jgi:hypothetical protein